MDFAKQIIKEINQAIEEMPPETRIEILQSKVRELEEEKSRLISENIRLKDKGYSLFIEIVDLEEKFTDFAEALTEAKRNLKEFRR